MGRNPRKCDKVIINADQPNSLFLWNRKLQHEPTEKVNLDAKLNGMKDLLGDDGVPLTEAFKISCFNALTDA
jgi:hypothetical protein